MDVHLIAHPLFYIYLITKLEINESIKYYHCLCHEDYRMATIDKTMYEKLKKWCDRCEGSRPANQHIMYVNSHDRTLTNATIRKLMFEMNEEDVHSELYSAFYSAGIFYRNMRKYYTGISKLYFRNPMKDAPLLKIIEDIPSTCGWITLIVGDIEELSEDTEKIQEMMDTLFAFASKHSNIILTGSGDYRDVIAGNDRAMHAIDEGSTAKEDERIKVGYYDQGTDPVRENITFKTEDLHRKELNFYWDALYKQLETDYFDYEDYKSLFKETLGYILPRVTEEKIYRKDLILIENIGAICSADHEIIEGCRPWEFEAARKFARGLHEAIVNRYGENDDLSEGEMKIDAVIEEPTEDHGALHISGSICIIIDIGIDTACQKMDKLSETIHRCTYRGNAKIEKCRTSPEIDSGTECTITENEMQEILAGCGFSCEMTNFLASKNAISPRDIVNAICRAPITLDEKSLLLGRVMEKCDQTFISDRLRDISEAKEALFSYATERTHDKPLVLFNEWYDIDELRLKSEACGLFTRPEAAERYINNEEYDNDTDEGYYRLEEWDPHDIDRENPRYDYFYYHGKVCWFEKLFPEKQEHGNTYYMPKNREFADGDLDINIVTPYKAGDIVLIDCRPFGPPFHAMILESRHQYDCCFPNIVFRYPGTDEWSLTPLKHKRFYKDTGWHTYEPMLSPLYRLRRVRNEEMTEEDDKLLELSKAISGSEEKAETAWNRWHDASEEELNWEKVREVFELS